jgi:hypothetical protein
MGPIQQHETGGTSVPGVVTGNHWPVTPLAALVRVIAPAATMHESCHQDPDEGWEMTVLHVATGAADPASRALLEEQFFTAVQADPDATLALTRVIVEFA